MSDFTPIILQGNPAEQARQAARAENARDLALGYAADALAAANAADTMSPREAEVAELAAKPTTGKQYEMLGTARGRQPVYFDGQFYRYQDTAAIVAVPSAESRLAMKPLANRWRYGARAPLATASQFAAAAEISAGADFGRLFVDPFTHQAEGVVVQDDITNLIRNDWLRGFRPGVIGVDGAWPAYWETTDSVLTGCTITLAEAEFADGSPAIQVMLDYGTTAPVLFLHFTGVNTIPAVTGDTFSVAFPFQVTAGSRGISTEIGANITTIEAALFQFAAAPSWLPGISAAQNLRRLVDCNSNAPDWPATLRYTGTLAATSGTITYVSPGLAIQGAAGVGGSITFLIGPPWCAKTASAHYYRHRNDGVASLRPADLAAPLDITAMTQGENLIVNGWPVESARGWFIPTSAASGTALAADADTGELVITATGTGAAVAEQRIPTVSGRTYAWRATGNKAAGAATPSLVLINGTSGASIANQSYNSASPIEHSGTFTAGSDHTVVQFGYSGTGIAGEASRWSGIEIRETGQAFDFVIEAPCASQDSTTLLHLRDAADNGVRLYRSGFTFYAAPETAGSEGTAVALGDVCAHMPLQIACTVTPGGDTVLSFNGKAAVTLTGAGHTFIEAWIGRKADSSQVWNGGVGRFEIDGTALTPTGLALFDSFDRADGVLGTPEQGSGAWINCPAGVSGIQLGTVKSGAMALTDETLNGQRNYASQNFTEDVVEMGALVTWNGSGNEDYTLAVLIISHDPADGVDIGHIVAGQCIHAVFSAKGLNVGFFEANGAFSALDQVVYPTTCALDGTTYPIGIRLDAERSVLHALLPGNHCVSLYDARFGTHGGATATWELDKLTPPSGNAPTPRMPAVWARTAGSVAIDLPDGWRGFE